MPDLRHRQGLADACQALPDRPPGCSETPSRSRMERHRRSGLLELQAGRLKSALRDARRCPSSGPAPSRTAVRRCQLLRGDWLDAVGNSPVTWITRVARIRIADPSRAISLHGFSKPRSSMSRS